MLPTCSSSSKGQDKQLWFISLAPSPSWERLSDLVMKETRERVLLSQTLFIKFRFSPILSVFSATLRIDYPAGNVWCAFSIHTSGHRALFLVQVQFPPMINLSHFPTAIYLNASKHTISLNLHINSMGRYYYT